MMRRAAAIALLLCAACGARSSLEDTRASGAAGGSGATVQNGGAAEGGQPEGGSPTGGAAPCIPVVCDPGWATSVPETLIHTVQSIAGGACGGVAVASATSKDGYLRLFDSNGTQAWKHELAVLEDPLFRSATAVTNEGDVLYASSFDAPFTVDGENIQNANDDEDIALLRFDKSGALEWARTFGSSGRDRPTSLMAMPDGSLLLGGRSSQSIDLGGGPLSGAFIAKLSASGEHLWSYSFATNGDGPESFLAAGDGDVWMVARVRGEVQMPGGEPFEAGLFSNVVFVARIHADGSHVFSKLFGDSSSASFVLPSWPNNGLGFGPASSGGVRFVTAMAGSLDFGGGDIEIGTFPLQYGLVVVELAPDGAFVAANNVIPDPEELTSTMFPEDHAVTSAARPAQVLVGLRSDMLTAVGGTIVATQSLGGVIDVLPTLVRFAPIQGGTLIAKHVSAGVEIAGQTVPPQSLMVANVCDP